MLTRRLAVQLVRVVPAVVVPVTAVQRRDAPAVVARNAVPGTGGIAYNVIEHSKLLSTNDATVSTHPLIIQIVRNLIQNKKVMVN